MEPKSGDYVSANVDSLLNTLSAYSAEEGLRWVSAHFGKKAAFSTALGLEDQVIAHLIGKNNLDIRIFTLDTGRLFQETYDVLDLTQKKYTTPIETYFPDAQAVQALVTAKGPNSFYDSVENRKECCHIRKVEPLNRALKGVEVWITGVRAEQSANRSGMTLVEWDEQHKLIKYNPLLKWTEQEVLEFVEVNSVPVNSLHKKGYPSIGCAPCTRAVLPGEDIRAGRWWWESSSKECGLHENNKRMVKQ